MHSMTCQVLIRHGLHVVNEVLNFFRILAFVKFRISGLYKSGMFIFELLASFLIQMPLLNWIRKCNQNCFIFFQKPEMNFDNGQTIIWSC